MESEKTYVLDIPGTPPSFNAVGHSGNRWAWTKAEKEWKGHFFTGLLIARVPKKVIAHVTASAILHFNSNRNRDEGNYRTIIEKALGDALQLGWLTDDSPEFFEFNRVTFGEKQKPPKTLITLECRLK